MRLSRNHVRAKVTIALLIVGSLLVAGVGYRGFIDRHDQIEVDGIIRVADQLPASERERWESILDHVPGLPGVSRTLEDVCGEVRCDASWGLISMDQAPDDYSVRAQVRLYGFRGTNRLSAMRHHLLRPHRGWHPNNTIAQRVSASDVSVCADSVRLTCYSFREDPDEGADCIWSFYARYGQYVFGIMYSSDQRPTARQAFIEEYVAGLDRFVGDHLNLG